MKTVPIVLTLLAAVWLCACNPDKESPVPRPPIGNPGGGTPDMPSQTTRRMKITAGTAVFTATLAGNPAATAFRSLLPMTVQMGELNGNEKYYYLPSSLPTTASAPETIRSGDLMLFGSDCLVLFYASFTTPYRYTPIGRMDDASGLEAALGRGAITVKFELSND